MYDKFKIFIIGIIICLCGTYIFNCFVADRKVDVPIVDTSKEMQEELKKHHIEIDDKKITAAKETAAVKTTYENIKQVAKEQQVKNGSDLAPVVKENEVELKQYHIYNAPKVLREVGVKLDSQDKISGISYGVKKRIDAKGKYIGVRAEYDWKEKDAEIWATYSW